MPHNLTALNILPWAHVYSQTCELYYNILYDNKTVISSSRDNFIKECGYIQPDALYLVPRVLDAIKSKISRFDKPIIKYAIPFIFKKLFGANLMYIFTGGAKLNKDTKEFYSNHGYVICEGYGCTETSPMVSVNHYSQPRDINSIGKILDDIDVEIIDGEIQVSGPNVMLGYWNEPDLSSKSLVERENKIWYKTGDSGYIDNGFLFYDGRINDNYKLSNGKFVNVSEVEEIIKHCHPENIVVFGENSDKNELITTKHISQDLLTDINSKLEPYLRISQVHVIGQQEWDTFLTPKMSIKRKLIIDYIKNIEN
jgi:long-chain acyl-CoA synthetase